jgi:hypothetical protein
MALSTHWKQHIEAWQGSGLSQADYCRRHGLNANTFSGRLRDYRSLPEPAAPALIPVRLEPAEPEAPPAGPLVLRTASGHRLELPPSCGPRWLAELLRCLG